MSEAAATPRPHPRIRARRVEVQREAGRRRLRFVVVMAAVAAVFPAGWAVTRSPLIDVDRVVVAGAERTPHAEIVESARLPKAMTDISPRSAARRIETLPWVADAQVQRRWPGTVAISVRERVPVAVVQASAAAWALADRRGRILAPAGGPQPELPVVQATGEVGPPGSAVGDATADMLALVGRLDSELAARVDLVRSAAGGAAGSVVLELVLDTGTSVTFGALRDVEAKVVALRTLVKKADLQGAATLDVRVPSAPVLTRR